MRVCKTLIIGAGHAALGIALAAGDHLICEESEFLAADYSLTLKAYAKEGWLPRTEPGKELLACYESLGLVGDNRFHCGALEVGLSRFALQKGVKVLLKCRVIQRQRTEQGWLVTLLTNSGLETVVAERIVDTRVQRGSKRFSLLFTRTQEDCLAKVQALFPEGTVEPAFYDSQGALHLPVAWDADYNAVLRQIYDRWAEGQTGEKILLLAPRFALIPETGAVCDPIAAFEEGLRYGKEAL